MLDFRKKMSLLFLGFSVCTLLFPGVMESKVDARDIRIIDGVQLKKAFQYILPARKRNSSNTIINLSETKVGKSLMYNIVDDRGNKMMDFDRQIMTGHRISVIDRSEAGKNYRLAVREDDYYTHRGIVIYGSWSPDSW